MFESRKPWAQAAALVVIFWQSKAEQGHHLEDGMFNLNYISEVLPFSNKLTHSRRKLIGTQAIMQTAASKYP